MKTTRTFSWKGLIVFAFLLCMVSQTRLFGQSYTCDICHKQIVCSPVYPADLKEEYNHKTKTLEGKIQAVCQHVFCKDCLLEDRKQKTSYHECPCCEASYTVVLPTDIECQPVYDKMMIMTPDADAVLKVAYDLCKKGSFDQALEVVSHVPNEVRTKSEFFYGKDNEATIEHERTYRNNICEIYFLAVEDYIQKENYETAAKIVDKALFLTMEEIASYKQNIDEDDDEDDEDDDDGQYETIVRRFLQIAHDYVRIKQTNKGLEILSRAINMLDSEEMKESDKTYYYIFIATVFTEANNMDQGLEYLDKAYEFTETLNNVDKAYAFTEIAKTYITIAKEDQALVLLEQAKELTSTITDDRYDRRHIYVEIFQAYAKTKHTQFTLEALDNVFAASAVFEESEKIFREEFHRYVVEEKRDQALQTLTGALPLVYEMLGFWDEDHEKKELVDQFIEGCSV